MDQSSLTSSDRAGAPFDQGGDVILRSSDKVDFHVYKVILSFASPFFKDMFSLAQPVGSGSDADMHVVEMTEDKVTIDCLLRYIYPILDPYIGNLGVLERVLETALKYDLTQPIHLTKQLLPRFMSSRPLRIYALCCRLGCEAEAKMAAEIWKEEIKAPPDDIEISNWADTLPARSFIPEMENISAGAFAQLLRYTRGGDVPSFCQAPGQMAASQVDNPAHWDATRVFQTPSFNRQDADLAIQSVDGVVFPVHRLLLELHTTAPTVNSLLQWPVVQSTQPAKLPLIQVEEQSNVLAQLLQQCYPLSTTTSTYWSPEGLSDPFTMRVMRAAVRYGLSSVVGKYKEQWRHHATAHPARLYRIACELDWSEEARLAAEHLAMRPAQALEELEVESLSVGQYFRLLKFVHHCQQETFAIIEEKTTFNHAGWKTMFLAAVQWSFTGSSKQADMDGKLTSFLTNKDWNVMWSDYPRLAVAYHSSQSCIKEAIAKVCLRPLSNLDTLTLNGMGQRSNCSASRTRI